jgi:hypothetical protein
LTQNTPLRDVDSEFSSPRLAQLAAIAQIKARLDSGSLGDDALRRRLSRLRPLVFLVDSLLDLASRPAWIAPLPRPVIPLPAPAVDADSANAPSDPELARQWRIVRKEFDAPYYLAQNPDVAKAKIDPIVHFLEYGWREGRAPNESFSVTEYLDANQDIAASAVNPFLHFLTHGRVEGRPLRAGSGHKHSIITNAATVEQRLARSPEVPASKIGSDDRLRSALGRASRSEYRKLHVSVSHDDFTTSLGGIQLCLQREAEAFERNGFDHVHVFPARQHLFTERANGVIALGVLINGSLAGYFEAGTVSKVFGSDIASETREASLAIHSLLGHDVQALTAILRALRLTGGRFWIHDFASVCAGHNLLRNDVEFCGAPAIDSAACNLCIYGERREIQVADHAALFEAFDLTVVAPSQRAMEVWKGASSFRRGGELVHPHCRLIPRNGRPRSGERQAAAGPKRLKIAFLGFPTVHKGWSVYRDLVFRFGSDPRYTFYHLGSEPQAGMPLHYREVLVGIGPSNAMIAAVEDLEIDVALIWSMCQETFCFAAYEAVAGGAAIVTSDVSGNVTSLVDEMRSGLALANEAQLYELFESGKALGLRRSARTVEHYDLEYSDMSADFIGASPR